MTDRRALGLPAHASFPADTAVRSNDTLDTVLGRFDCLLCEVLRGDDTMIFWFAIDHPGMPIRHIAMASSCRRGT